MIALKKKREEAKARAAAEAAAKATAETEAPSSEPTSTPTPGLSLLGGVAGKKTKRQNSEQAGGQRRSPGEIRLQKDISGLSDFDDIATPEFPDPNELTKFNVYIKPEMGYWKGAKYQFNFSVPSDYPHKPPKIICHTKIFHPNIDLDGNVCLNILREDWKPVLDINTVIHGLVFLFTDPNTDDPLNKQAANLLRSDERGFERQVRRALGGGIIQGERFPNVLA